MADIRQQLLAAATPSWWKVWARQHAKAAQYRRWAAEDQEPERRAEYYRLAEVFEKNLSRMGDTLAAVVTASLQHPELPPQVFEPDTVNPVAAAAYVRHLLACLEATPTTPTTDLFKDVTLAARVVVGGKRAYGLSRLVAIAKSNESVERKLDLMGQTGLPRPDVSAAELAALLKVTPTAIKKTRWWKARMKIRQQQTAEAQAPYARKHGPRRPWWKRRGSGPARKPPKG